MGTIDKEFWIPTDASVSISHTFNYDLEDGGGWEDQSWDARSEEMPEGRTRTNLEESLRESVYEEGSGEFSNIYLSDVDSYDIEIEWNQRTLTVCEWCDSPNCSGDPEDCENAPEQDDDEDDEPVVLMIIDEAQQIQEALANAPETEAMI